MKKKRANKIEKPVFRRMFGKRFLIWMIAVIVIGFIGSDIAIKVYEREREIEWGDYSEDMYSRIESVYMDYYGDEQQAESKQQEGTDTSVAGKETLALSVDGLSEEEKEEQFKLWVEYEAYVHSLYDTAYMLLDADTLDTVAQSSYNKIYLLARPEGEVDDSERGMEGDFTIYTCEDKKVVEKLRNAYEEIDYDREGVLKVWIEDVYVDGFTFVPGKVKLIGLSFMGAIDYDNVVKELDFTPEDTTGYTHIVTDEMVENKELVGPYWYHNDMPEMEKFIEEAKEETIAIPEFKEELENSSGYGVHYTANGNMRTIDITGLSVGEGDLAKEFWFVTLNQNSFWKEYRPELMLVYGGLVFVAFCIALITGYTAYMKQKSFYETDQYRRNMTNTMAHDLKSPLMVVSGFAENLLEQDLEERSKRYTKSIMENVQYMNRIIEKVLELSKVENAEYKLQKENVDLRKLSEKLVKNYTARMDERGLEIKLSGECTVSADELCMTQVLDNLIGNAVKYSIEGSVIEIRLMDKKYEIANTSAAEFDVDVKDLVNPFVKGDNSRSGKKGSGIGLTIAKNLLEQHGYQLELECNDGMFVAAILL